jgi:hypothetical protein
MKSKRYLVLVVFVVVVGLAGGQMFVKGQNSPSASKVAVVWTSGDSEVAHKVCFMYTHNAKRAKWFDEVVLVIWGPSSRILAGDKKLQTAVKQMMKDGVVVQACVVCADMRGLCGYVRGCGPPARDGH